MKKQIIRYFIIFITITAYYNCERIPKNDDFFTKKEYINLGSIENFDPLPIYKKLLKYDIETANKNILNAMEYSFKMINALHDGFANGNSTHLDVFIRLFWFRVLLNENNIDIKPELKLIEKYDGGKCTLFTVQIFGSVLANFYSNDFFKKENSTTLFNLFEDSFDIMHKQYHTIQYDRIAERLSKVMIKECPDVITPYYYLIHIYAKSGKCSKVSENFYAIEKYLSKNAENTDLYSSYVESILTYNKDLKEYISQFCDMEDLKN